MPDDKMYELICRERFAKIETAVTNDLPHAISNIYWKVIATIVPLFGALLFFILRS